MAKKKNNKVIGLVSLVLVLGVIVGAYFYIKNLGLNKEEKPESTVITVQSYSSSDLAEFTFIASDGQSLTFERENEYTWLYPADEKFPVNAEAVESSATSCLTILATRELEEESDEFGFSDPTTKFSYKFNLKDGTTETREYTVGVSNSFNGGTYVRDDTNGKIYLCSTNPKTAFDKKLSDYILLDTAAYTVDPTSTKTVVINNGNGGSVTITDTDGIEDFLGEPFNLFDCSEWVAYGADDAAFAEYGIDKSEAKGGIRVDYKTTVTVKDENGESSAIRQDTTYNVWLGNHLDDGSVYYTITDSSIVYKISAEDFETVMKWIDYVPAPESETTEITETQASNE